MPRYPLPLVVLALLVPTLAGCTSPTPPPLATPSPTIQVVDLAGKAIPFAQVSATSAAGTILVFNADLDGKFPRAELPAASTSVQVAAAGYGAVTLDATAIPDRLQLAAGTPSAKGILSFRTPVDLVCTTPDQAPHADCGQFGEPVVEVAGDGTIWASATCCVGKAPPIWTSRDGGATFQQLRNTDTGLIRDSFGIEGDFAMDDAGNVYFFDISAATVWFTSYTAAGAHRWTVPWTGVPIVDRPWVRAGVEDQVWIIYNTGTQTAVYGSVDGGKTWTPTPMATFPCGLGNAGQGPQRNDLYVAASCGDTLTVWTSHDGAVTWDAGQKVPSPNVTYDKSAGRGLELMNPPVADEAGNLYIPFTHFVDKKNEQNAVFVARRDAGGAWGVPVQVSQSGMNRLPWGAAGQRGHVGFLWYHADGNFSNETKAQWRLQAGASVDADATAAHYQTTVADPAVLYTGTYGRALGDFIETDVTPDGRLVAVYGMRTTREGGSPAQPATTLTNRFISSDGGLDLAPLVFLNGP